MAEQQDPRQSFWILIFVALIAMIVYVISILFAKDSLLPVLGLLGAAGCLSMWGAYRQYQKRRWIPAIFAGLVTWACAAFAFMTCMEIGDIFHIM